MSLYCEFRVPAADFALDETFRRVPDAVVEIERVVATDDVLTPYFWVSGDRRAFEDAADGDGSVRDLRRLDEFEETTLYRADWTDGSEAIVYAYAGLDAAILDATGSDRKWELRVQFDDGDQLDRFRDYCDENGAEFTLTRLHEVTHPRSPRQYGLTEKQEEALVAAWEMRYFETPREATLSDIAGKLDISEQALSARLRRGYDTLVANTLRVTPPSE